jgi:hypothetical protein
MALNDIRFEKQNGGIGRPAPNQDPVSGLILSLNMQDEPSGGGFDNVGGMHIIKLSFYEQLALLGIRPVDEPEQEGDYVANVMDYHVKEFFRMSPTGTLYLAFRVGQDVEIVGADIVALQNYAQGSIRQMGIINPDRNHTWDYQDAAAQLEAEHKPLSILLTCMGEGRNLADFTAENTEITDHMCNMSMVIGCDLDPVLLQRLGTSSQQYGYYGCIGTALGAVSAAKVHESIAWVGKFPLGLKMPGLITGELINEVQTGDQNLLNGNRYIFVRTHAGDADNYFNDSFTFSVPTSDYAYIENVRTMDKAIRGIRSNLLPHLNAPLYVDPVSGKLAPNTVAFLETEAGKALEDMERAGELSGYRVEIDPEQNVLASSQVEIQIKNVPVGVMRKVLVRIGFVTNL